MFWLVAAFVHCPLGQVQGWSCDQNPSVEGRWLHGVTEPRGRRENRTAKCWGTRGSPRDRDSGTTTGSYSITDIPREVGVGSRHPMESKHLGWSLARGSESPAAALCPWEMLQFCPGVTGFLTELGTEQVGQMLEMLLGRRRRAAVHLVMSLYPSSLAVGVLWGSHPARAPGFCL